MSLALTVTALVLKLIGAVFLLAAAIGLVRFKDPFQRMHAATKAGTIGAGLVVAGTICGMSDAEGVAIGALAILFLFLTAPVAGHLLGRAAYVSGAELIGVEARNALEGVLERAGHHTSSSPAIDADQEESHALAPVPRLASMRFYIVPPHDQAFVARVLELAKSNQVPVEACAVIDPDFLAKTNVTVRRLAEYKGKLADAVADTQEQFVQQGRKFSLLYLEGHADDLVPPGPGNGHLMVLSVRDQSAWMDAAALHSGPVLCVGDRVPGAAISSVAVLDDGSDELLTGLLAAVQAEYWTLPDLHIMPPTTPHRIAQIEQALNMYGLKTRVAGVRVADLPVLSAGYHVVICRQGSNWLGSLANSWLGEVLIIPRE